MPWGGSTELLHTKPYFAFFLVDAKHDRPNVVTNGNNPGRVINACIPQIGNMDQSVYVISHFNEDAELGELRHLTLDYFAASQPS